AGTEAAVHRNDQSEAVVLGAADAVAHAKIEVEALGDVVVSIEAQRGDCGSAVVVVGGFQRLHRPAVGVGESAAQRCGHADRQIAAVEIRGNGNRILGNPVGVEYAVPARIDKGP